jgi:polyisoprenyl-teichoic acid--peptidoglycan teichoic acid transferase
MEWDDTVTRAGATRRPARSERDHADGTMTETVQRAPAPAGRVARRHRRAQGLRGALGITALATVVPGSGFLYAGRRALGVVVLLLAVGLAGATGWYLRQGLHSALRLVFDPKRLTVAAVVVGVVLVLWVLSIVLTYLMVRPRGVGRWQNLLGSGFVLVLCLVVAAPLAVAARYSLVQADLVSSVFQHNQSATRPTTVSAADPWGGRTRVNLLLLGGDGGVDREGVRTDSMILASMDVRTGRTVLFSLPRNLMDAPFPVGSPLAKAYPDGFTGPGDAGNWMLNAIYREVPLTHPGILGKSDNEGADALKMAVQAILGLPVDYYLLVNLAGFRSVVNAMGGVTVNINQPVPIGGNTDLGVAPDSYLQPGPHQRLNGFQALWFSRGRYGLDDYQRMDRQRCMVDALIAEAKPLRLLRRYEALAATGKKILRSDLPQELLPAFADLILKVKENDVRSVVFRRSERFSPESPDFEWMRSQVQEALTPARKASGPAGGGTPSSSPTPSSGSTPGSSIAQDTTATCAYHPVG